MNLLPRIQNKLTKKIYYFRFFSEENPEKFWYTVTSDATGFSYANINDFIPLDKTWKELLDEEL